MNLRNTNKPLKVLMLSSSYPRSREDSAGIFVRYLAEKLSQSGLEVHLLAPADLDGGTCVEGNVRVHRFRYLPASLRKLAYGSGILPNLRRNPLLWIEVPFFLATMTFSLLRLVAKEKPDLLHAHWVFPQGLIAVLTKLFYKTPVVLTAHGSDAFSLRGNLMRKLKMLALRKSDAWTSNTRATSGVFGMEASLPKPVIIPMGVDVKHFQSGERTRLRGELPENEFLILFVGRLVKDKGLTNLLTALTLLPADLYDKIDLWVVGNGDFRTRIEDDAKTLGIREKIRFWGPLGNEQLPDFYAAADLLVVPSETTEGLAIVLLEAFAARLCVVATRVGGVSEVVEDSHTGVLVEPRNPAQLAVAMENLLRDGNRRAQLAENGYAKAKKYYDWEKIAQAFESLYRDVISQTHRT